MPNSKAMLTLILKITCSNVIFIYGDIIKKNKTRTKSPPGIPIIRKRQRKIEKERKKLIVNSFTQTTSKFNMIVDT